MSAYPIPDDALDDRLAFIGTSGSGKTYNAGSAIERILASNGRAVIVDPLGVWWGLRLTADGKPSRFNLPIFGGAHGDLPLNEGAGSGPNFFTVDLPDGWAFSDPSPRPCFYQLWKALHGKESWDANPDVVVLTFAPIIENVDRIAA